MNVKKINSLIVLVVIAFLLIFGVSYNSKVLLFQKLDQQHSVALLNETISLTKELSQENDIYNENKINNEKGTKSSTSNNLEENNKNFPIYNNFLDMFSSAKNVHANTANIKTSGLGTFNGEVNSIIKTKVSGKLKYATEISNHKNRYANVLAHDINIGDIIKNINVPMELQSDGTQNRVLLMETPYSFTANYFINTLNYEIGNLFYNINEDTIKQVLLFNYNSKTQTYYAELLLHNNAFILHNALFKLSNNISFVNIYNFNVISSMLKIQVNKNCEIQYISSTDTIASNFSASIISGHSQITLTHTEHFNYLEYPFSLSGKLI